MSCGCSPKEIKQTKSTGEERTINGVLTTTSRFELINSTAVKILQEEKKEKRFCNYISSGDGECIEI
jgi:hypothetical protein